MQLLIECFIENVTQVVDLSTISYMYGGFKAIKHLSCQGGILTKDAASSHPMLRLGPDLNISATQLGLRVAH